MSGSSETFIGDGLVEDPHRIDGVTEVLEGAEDSADLLSLFDVARIESFQHLLGKGRIHADAAGGESGQVELVAVHDGRLLADAADDERRIDDLDEAVEVGVDGWIVLDDGILDEAHEAGIVLRALRPDVFAKGGDWPLAVLMEKDVPPGIAGKEAVIFGNMTEIYEFHSKYVCMCGCV